MRVAVGADHAGFVLKNEMPARLGDKYLIIDLGAHSFDPDDDYPDYVQSVARGVISGRADRGIPLILMQFRDTIEARKYIVIMRRHDLSGRKHVSLRGAASDEAI